MESLPRIDMIVYNYLNYEGTLCLDVRRPTYVNGINVYSIHQEPARECYPKLADYWKDRLSLGTPIAYIDNKPKAYLK